MLGMSFAALLLVGLGACGSSDSKDTKSSSSEAGSSSETCQPKHKFTTITPGTLTAVFTAYPPYADVENGNATGIDGEIITAVAKMECLKLDAKVVDAAGIPATITSGRADVAGGDWWRSKEREKVIAMSDPTYLDGFSVLSKDGLDSVAALKDKNIGDLQGNVWNAEAKKVFGDNYHLYRTQDQVMQDLRNGRLDAAFSTPGSAAYYAEKANLTGFKLKVIQPDPSIPATEKAPQSGIMHSLKNPDLTAALNADIESMKSDGTLEAIVKKHGLPASVIETGAPYFL
jgi:polar amino acid transport system substrate-binding protein